MFNKGLRIAIVQCQVRDCDRVAKVVFLTLNPSNFRRPLQSLLLKYTAGNLQVT